MMSHTDVDILHKPNSQNTVYWNGRNAWQNLMCSPRSIVLSPLANNSETEEY